MRFTFEVNTLAHYWLAKEFVGDMAKKNHGMVVTVASYAAYVVAPNMVDYAASKAAAQAFHEGLALELSKLSYFPISINRYPLAPDVSPRIATDIQ